jgi:ABC-type nitrate/sulfonate/bicarbonate transport system ATPase subunit
MTLFLREAAELFIATGTTMMLISHDLEEAVYLADEVLLLASFAHRRDPALRGRAVRTIATCPSPFIAKKSSRSSSVKSAVDSCRCRLRTAGLRVADETGRG